MAPPGLFCQVCLVDCPSIGNYKKHLRSEEHRQEKAKLFQKEVFQGHVYLDHIDILGDRPKYPLLGLSLVTLCFGSEDGSLFYLCHACEEPVSDISDHLDSPEHCRNYYNYTNPDVLRFSWIPSSKIHTMVDPVAHSNVKKNWERHTGKLQVLDLPPDLFETVRGTSYVKAMATLGENDNLLKQTTAARPKQMTIQTYLETPNRKHPLLGLEHLVECSSEEQTDRHLYLCTVCKLTLTDHKIINHLLSFDHIRCYINAWHPSTLPGSYYYTSTFHDMMQDLAKQMEEIHGTTITDMKQVVLLPALLFSSLEGASYVKALEMLEYLRNIHKESSVITSITPGDKLATPAQGGEVKNCPTSTPPAQGGEVKNCPTSAPPAQGSGGPGPTSTAEPPGGEMTAHHPTRTEPPTTVAKLEEANHPVMFCMLRCQVCNVKFEAAKQYFAHVKGWQHVQKMKTIFVRQADEPLTLKTVFYSSISKEFQYIKRARAEPVIGLLHIVMCVSTRDYCKPLCICLVCQYLFPDSSFRAHLNHPRHIKQTLLHQNPALLPFAWKGKECKEDLTSLAWEEENAQGPDHMILKIIDLPSWMILQLRRLSHVNYSKYQHACKKLDEHFSFDWTSEVPKMVTLDELQSSLTYPQLGLEFLFRFKSALEPWRSLCLLCERNLKEVEFSCHVFSFEHVKRFLNYAHPGSLDCEAKETPDVLLDLAKQAAEIRPNSSIQIGKLSLPTCPNKYETAVKILERRKKMAGKGGLIPVLRVREKLVPTEPLKKVDNGFGSDTSPEVTKMPADKGRPDVNNHIPQHPDVKVCTPQRPGVIHRNPRRPDVNDRTPRPIPVEKEAVSVEDSRVHKPDEKKCPTQNTSVERRADTGTGMDRETQRKQSTEERKTEKDQATGSAVKLTGRRQSLESQETAWKRKRDSVVEEAGTKRGATGKDATARVGRDLNAESESGTPKKGQRREHTRPEAGGKRQRLGHVDKRLAREKTQKCWANDFVLPPDVPQLDSDIEYMMELLDTSDCQPRANTLISDAQEKPFNANLRQHQVESPTDSWCHPQVTPEDIVDPTVTNTALWQYLSNTERTEPVIGVSMMTEYQWPTEHNARNYFRCHCCTIDMVGVQYGCFPVINHLISADHRYNYIKKLRPRMVHDWPSSEHPNGRPRELRDLAQQVERDEGCGKFRVKEMRPSTSQSLKAAAKSPLKSTGVKSHLTQTTPAIPKSSKSVATVSQPTTSTGAVSKATSTFTTCPTVARTCDSAASATPKNKVASKTAETTSKTATNQQVTKTSVTGTKTHTTSSTTCQTTEDASKTGRIQTYVRSNSEDTTQKRDTQLLLSLLTAVSPPASTSGSSPSETRRSESSIYGPAVGLNFMVAVTHDEKRCALFCLLCKTRPTSYLHRFSTQHRSNYVRLKCPELTSDLSDTELLKIATELAKEDTGGRTQDMPMNSEREYEELTKAEVPEVLIKIQAILRQQISQDSREWRQVPQDPGPRQEAPRCSGTRPWPPQYSVSSQNAPQDVTSSLSLPGITTDSRLSCYLKAMSEADRKRVVGLSSMLESQSLQHIGEHTTSFEHQFKYMWEKHPSIMAGIWNLEDMSEEQKMSGFELAVNVVAERERFEDNKNSYDGVQAASFNEGIYILEDIGRQQNLTSSCPPADQQPPEAADDKESVRLTKSLTETTPISVAIVKTEPVPEPLSTLNTHDSNITVTIKQEVKQEDHTHPCFSGHAEMGQTVKRVLDDVSSNEDGDTVKRRRISMSPDGGSTCDSPSGPYSDISSPASQCSSPHNEVAKVKVETTSVPTQGEPSQMRPRPKLDQILNSLRTLVSSDFNLECSPTKPVSAASIEPSTTPWSIDSSPAKREPEPELHSTLSEVKQALPPLPKLTSVTAVPLTPPANKDVPSSEPITSIFDMNFRQLASLMRAEQSGKDVSHSRAISPESAAEIVTRTSTSTQTSVGRVKPRMQLDSNCRMPTLSIKPNQSVDALKWQLAAPKPADDDVWNYENRQFTPGRRATDVIGDDDQSLESHHRAANPAGEDSPVTSNPPAARAISSTELQPRGDQATQLYCNLGISVGEPSATPATVIDPNTAQALQASIYNTMVYPFNIEVGPYMGSPVTVVNPNPTSQQFNDCDYRINQPTSASVIPSGSLPAAGYGTPVYPYSQLTPNPYFLHGYPSGTGAQNSYFTRGYLHGREPAGISRAPDQHSVFSQYVNYSVGPTGGLLYPIQTPPQQGTGQDVMFGGAYTTNITAEAWLEMQRQQQPQ